MVATRALRLFHSTLALASLCSCASSTSSPEIMEKPKWVIERPLEFKHLPVIEGASVDVNGCGELFFQKKTTDAEGSYFMRMDCSEGKEIRQPSSDAYLEFLPSSLLPFQAKQLDTWRNQAVKDSGKKNAAPIICFRGKMDREPCSSGGGNVVRVRSLTSNKNTYARWELR